MKKTITVDGREIELQTNALVPILYKKEFKKDFFAVINDLAKGEIDIEELFGLAWVFARVSDKEIPSMEEWLSGFDEFPILDFSLDLIELATVCITTKKNKGKNTKATAKH